MRFDPEDVTAIANAVAIRLQNSTIHEQLFQGGGDRLGYTETDAAEQIGVAKHVLRDARRRGEISARKVGRRWVYSRECLAAYLNER